MSARPSDLYGALAAAGTAIRNDELSQEHLWDCQKAIAECIEVVDLLEEVVDTDDRLECETVEEVPCE